MGKGSKRRPTDEKKYRENYERVFGKRCVKCRKLEKDCKCEKESEE